MAKADPKAITASRVLALTIGLAAGALGCYGAYEMACKTDGGYLIIAAPVVAAAAALIPYLAESAWRAGQRVKSLALWLVLIPAAAVVFFGAAERVHTAKAGAEAERAAMHSAVTRAGAALTQARAKADKAEVDATAARSKGRKQCDASCLAKWEAEAGAARGRVSDAAAAVTAAETKATVESPLRAPVWLLPLALDLVAFVAIWTGLGVAKPPVEQIVRRRKRTARHKPQLAPAALRVVG